MVMEHIDDANFSDKIAKGISLVDFWASWCGPCQMFGPIFESSADKIPDVNFFKFEINESNRRMAAKYGVRSIPAVLVFKDGELVEARTGLMDQDTLMDWVSEIKG